MWTIYDHPIDYPIGFIARMWMVEGGREQWTPQILTSSRLADLRDKLRSKGLTPIPRAPADDATIVETWL